MIAHTDPTMNGNTSGRSSWRKRLFRKKRRNTAWNELPVDQDQEESELNFYSNNIIEESFRTEVIISKEHDPDEEEFYNTVSSAVSSRSSAGKSMNAFSLMPALQFLKEGQEDHSEAEDGVPKHNKDENRSRSFGGKGFKRQQRSGKTDGVSSTTTESTLSASANLQEEGDDGVSPSKTRTKPGLRRSLSPRKWRNGSMRRRTTSTLDTSASATETPAVATTSAFDDAVEAEVTIQESDDSVEEAPQRRWRSRSREKHSMGRVAMRRNSVSHAETPENVYSIKIIAESPRQRSFSSSPQRQRRVASSPARTPPKFELAMRTNTAPVGGDAILSSPRPDLELTRKASVSTVSTQVTLKASNSKEDLLAPSEEEPLTQYINQTRSSSVHQHHRGRRNRHNKSSSKSSDIWSTLLYKVMKEKHGVENDPEDDRDHDTLKKNSDSSIEKAPSVASSKPYILFGREEDSCSSTTHSSSGTSADTSSGPHTVPSAGSSVSDEGSAFVTNPEDPCFPHDLPNDFSPEAAWNIGDAGSSAASSSTRSLAALLADVHQQGGAQDHTPLLLEQQLLRQHTKSPTPVTRAASNAPSIETSNSSTHYSGKPLASILKSSASSYAKNKSSTEALNQWLSTVRCSPFASHNNTGEGNEGEAPLSFMWKFKKPKSVRIKLEPQVSYPDDSPSATTQNPPEEDDHHPNIEVFRTPKSNGSGQADDKKKPEHGNSWATWVPCGPIANQKKGQRGAGIPVNENQDDGFEVDEDDVVSFDAASLQAPFPLLSDERDMMLRKKRHDATPIVLEPQEGASPPNDQDSTENNGNTAGGQIGAPFTHIEFEKKSSCRRMRRSGKPLKLAKQEVENSESNEMIDIHCPGEDREPVVFDLRSQTSYSSASSGYSSESELCSELS